MAQATQAVEDKVEPQQTQQNLAEQETSKTKVQSVELSEAGGSKTTGAGTSIDILLDMEVPVVVTIGQAEIPIQQLLQLGPGSVLKLDKPIDAPADLYLKDTKFANGSIVVVGGKFAVRIKEILGTDASAAATKNN